jgi:Tfp pilus assembly protein PilO
MNKQTLTLPLKNRKIQMGAVGALVLIVVWLVAFFLPQGSQLAKYTTKEQTLQGQQALLEAKVAQLRKTSAATPQLLLLQAKYDAEVPSTTDVFNYFTLISNTATASHITLSSITPGTGPNPVPGTSLEGIGFTLNTTGSYDNMLSFIKAIYALPRLTVINAVSVSGGGQQTSRATVLSETFTLTIFTTAK